jgi:hypothetical protein
MRRHIVLINYYLQRLPSQENASGQTVSPLFHLLLVRIAKPTPESVTRLSLRAEKELRIGRRSDQFSYLADWEY